MKGGGDGEPRAGRDRGEKQGNRKGDVWEGALPPIYPLAMASMANGGHEIVQVIVQVLIIIGWYEDGIVRYNDLPQKLSELMLSR